MFEVFISYKHSDEGIITEDYHIAQRLFDEIDKHGIKVFLSNDSIFSMGKSDYKKAIDEALIEAVLMIVVGTSLEHLTSGWVEYEYETFHEDILSGKKKNGMLFSYTSGVDQANLPRTLARYQNFQIESIDESKVFSFVKRALESQTHHTQKDDKQDMEHYGSHTMDEKKGFREKKAKSNYASDYRNELNRLRIQSGNSMKIDRIAIESVFEQTRWSEENPIVVLDLGSAYGFVANDRFVSDSRVKKVICVDYNKRVIERAQVLFADQEKMLFVELDIESDSFAEELLCVLLENGIDEVHILFSALTLHHLKDPNKVLRQIRKIMGRESWIILRGSDDGSKLCYPKPELMEAIIEKSASARGASDRFNGRKLYTQLTNSGFCDIQVFSDMKDLSALGFDERADLFEESFAYRINYFRRALEEDSENREVFKDLQWMEDALDEFENQFFESNFWYCEYDYAAIARKR